METSFVYFDCGELSIPRVLTDPYREEVKRKRKGKRKRNGLLVCSWIKIDLSVDIANQINQKHRNALRSY